MTFYIEKYLMILFTRDGQLKINRRHLCFEILKGFLKFENTWRCQTTYFSLQNINLFINLMFLSFYKQNKRFSNFVQLNSQRGEFSCWQTGARTFWTVIVDTYLSATVCKNYGVPDACVRHGLRGGWKSLFSSRNQETHART